ncbi:MAG: hypothetical protein HRU12_22505, partial [Phaeodactylibacter sp.]|nr:hypothetical protein [Phaeodactylibacter sp.]
DTIAPIADAGQDDTLNCFQPNLQVGGSSTSTGSRFTYSWSSNNPMPESAVDPYLTTNSAGSYTLTVVDTINGCKGVDSILVFEDFNEPVVSIANPDILNCQDSTVTLNANGSSTNGNFRYTWIAQSSSVALPSDTQIATVTSPGIYTLLIENLNNGCAAEDSVEVLQDINTPIVSIATADTITCNQPEITLNATLSGTNSNIDFSWSTAQGSIVSGQTSLQPLVNTSGVYELMVTDLDNFCSTSGTVLVAIDTLKPAITLETPDVLNCLDTALTINGNAVTPQVNWAWTTTNGNIAAEAATASPTIDQPGSYTATVTNPKNGCISTASLQISQDINQPEINVAPPSMLTCDQLTVALDGSGSDFAAGWTAGWKAPDGTTLSNHLQTTISQPGIYTLEILNTDNFCSNSTTITVTQDVVAPEVSLTGADTLNCEVLSVNLTSQVNQTGNLSFEWSSVDGQISSGMNSPNASTSMPGTYYFTAVNQDNGCSALDSLIVQQDTIAPELAPVVPTKLTCGLTSAWLTSTAEVNTNWTYEWSTAYGGSINSDANSNAVEAITAGTYNVLVTDTRNACTSTSTHLVSIDTSAPTILLELPGTLNCVDQNVPLTGMGSDSGVNFNLTWSTQDGTIEGPVNQLEAIAASPGTYMLTIQNTVNECIASRSITVSQDTIAPVASISTPEVLNCNNNSILIDATSSSAGAQFAYDWTTNDGLLLNGADGLQPEVGAAGQYALEITNLQNFCSSTATVSIMVDSLSPVVSLVTPDLLDCDQTSVPLAGSVNNAGSDYQLFWEGPANGFIADTNGLNPIIGQPGLYTLTVINNTNGCSASASTTALQDIVAPIVEAGDDFVIPCFPDMRQLDGFGSSEGEAFNYTWSTVNGVVIEGINTLSPAIDAPGIYTLVVLNTENGCAATDSVIVTQDLPEANVSTIQPLCFGDSGQINFVEVSGGFSPYVYSIDGGETYGSDANFSVQTPGNYQLIVQDINGCEVSLSTEIIQPDSLIIETAEKVMEIGIGDNEMIQLRSNYPLQDLVDISWSPNPGLDCYDCLSPTASPDFTTVYQVSATNSNGCKDEADIRVIVNRELPVFIPTGFSPNGDGNNDWFTVYS